MSYGQPVPAPNSDRWSIAEGEHRALGALTARPYGDAAVLIDLEGPEAVDRLRTAMSRHAPHFRARPGWSSLLIDTDVPPHEVLREVLTLDISANQKAAPSRAHYLDVDYDGADLSSVAELVGCSTADVVRLHTEPTYRVVLLGFTRAFAYLDGLDARLSTVPRLATPRTRVPAGSVGIAAGQTGIYPMASPGGWQLLGHTDSVLFDPRQMPPGFCAPGDTVNFRAR